MTIKLDWRFDSLDYLARVHMRELRDFASQAEEQFTDAMNAWKREATGLTEEQEAMMGDYLIERKENIEALLDRGYTLGILGLYTFLERFLNEVVDHVRRGGASIPQSKRGFTLYELRDHLQSVGIDMNAAPFDWNELNRFREVRNCIAHTNGWITDEFATRLNKLGMHVKVETRLELPDKFFQHCWMLVDQTYKSAYKKASEQFGYAKQHEMWLRPTRSFTEMELRAILEEAINAGVAAREKHTGVLLEEAQRQGLSDEDSCGWVWLELDPALLKQIEQSKIPNVTTSYNTTARVEDFKLHFKDIADYQRMSASFRGIEAAANILEKYGINSTVESMAD
jgi:hypothetical protein